MMKKSEALFAITLVLISLGILVAFAQPYPDVQTIIAKSVAANRKDFEAAPEFNYKECDRSGKGSKTYQVIMLYGSPYKRLIALNSEPLSPAQTKEELNKQRQVTAERRSESTSQRRQRIAKYQQSLNRDQAMQQQLTKAFTFMYLGQQHIKGFDAFVLKATPRPGYKPPNLDTQVLLGMEGQLWIDRKTFQWVKVTARVIRPVSIARFLARVEPGTRFEIENLPVSGGTWQLSHFFMNSQANVLYLFNRASQQDETYFDYARIRAADPKTLTN